MSSILVSLSLAVRRARKKEYAEADPTWIQKRISGIASAKTVRGDQLRDHVITESTTVRASKAAVIHTSWRVSLASAENCSLCSAISWIARSVTPGEAPAERSASRVALRSSAIVSSLLAERCSTYGSGPSRSRSSYTRCCVTEPSSCPLRPHETGGRIQLPAYYNYLQVPSEHA